MAAMPLIIAGSDLLPCLPFPREREAKGATLALQGCPSCMDSNRAPHNQKRKRYDLKSQRTGILRHK
jgi:hypothetical protein